MSYALGSGNQSQQLSLSVIVPTVGTSRHLYSTFNSIFKQICPANEIVVVWNGCVEPDWFACIDEMALQHAVPLLKVSHCEQVDISDSWTSGAEAATSDLLYFLGDDDLIDQDFLLLAKSAFEQNSDLDIFASNARYIDESGLPMSVNHVSNDPYDSLSSKMYVNQGSKWFEVPPPIFASVFSKKKLASINYFFYRGLAFDVWMFHHLAMASGYYLVYNHEPKVSYRRSASSSSNQICNHAMSYVEGLLEYQRIFNLEDARVASFRLHAAKFVVTALLKDRTHPLVALRLMLNVARIGFTYDLIKVVSSRAFKKLKPARQAGKFLRNVLSISASNSSR